MPYVIAVVGMVALDQAVKALVRAFIPLGGTVPLLPGILQLTYIQNTGAAFSSFSNSTLFLGVFSAVVSAALIYVLAAGKIRHPLGRWPTAMILAGALGNMIDRFVFRFVTDMFEPVFIKFAVFNVADIFVVVGVILLLVYVFFGWEKYEKPQRETPPQEGTE